MEQYFSTRKIAEMYGVTTQAVGLWVKSGLKYKLQRVPGRKIRRVFKVEDVDEFLNLGIRD